MLGDDTFIEITHADVYNELKDQRKIQEATLAQAKATNGRVTRLEGRSIGLWVSSHPFKFAGGLLIFGISLSTAVGVSSNKIFEIFLNIIS
jgi:hypothetical protein